jgi:hypothetical protein
MAKPLTQKQLKAMLAKAEAAQKKVTTRLEELEKVVSTPAPQGGDPELIRDPKTGLSPAQVEANKAVTAAAQSSTEAGIPAVVVKTRGASDRVVTPPSEAPAGTEWKWIGSKTTGMAGSGSWVLQKTATKPVTTVTTDNTDDTDDTEYKVVNGILLFNGQPFSGTYNGQTYENGKVKVVTKSGLTQEDIDAAVAKAVAGATAANNAMIAQMKAEAEAAKLATKQKASDKLTALFSAYGLESLAPFINTRIMADVSEEMLLLELYDRPEYQQRFPGMASLRKKSRTITEKDYMDIEKAMTQTARFFDLPKGFYDGPEDFGNLIGAEVSAKEFQDRLQIGQDLSRTLNPSVKQQLIDFYGVGEGDLTAFVLDADKALPLIQKQAKAAQFVGIGRAAGFELRGITSGQAENIAGTESYAKLSERELAQALGQAGQLRRTQKRLSGIEGQDYSEQEALSAVIEGSPQALLASQQRAAREGARFSARGGVTGSSLRSTASPI